MSLFQVAAAVDAVSSGRLTAGAALAYELPALSLTVTGESLSQTT